MDTIFFVFLIRRNSHLIISNIVEGPKVLLKSERMRILVGQILLACKDCSSLKQTETIINQKITKILCVGKELLIILEHHCLRLHFGMNGSEIIYKSDKPALESYGGKSYKKLTCILQFNTHTLALYDSTICIKPIYYVDILLEKACKDVMSPQFNISMVIECLYNTNNTDTTTNTTCSTATNTTYTDTTNTTYTNTTTNTGTTASGDSRPIMDSLMDQNILPGVGK